MAHRLKLVVIEGPDRGLESELVGTRVTIGSSSRNELVLSDPTVSRRHCEIRVVEGKYILKDLESTNGTRLNDAPVMEAYLTPGARVALGDTRILFEPKKKWERVSGGEADHFGELYGTSPVMRDVFTMLDKVGRTDLSCILIGETGTGKELAARALHAHGSRASAPLVVVDCGAITPSLIESELFGHEKGSFTGADRQRQGAFELADGGTVFLDEIGELPIELQPKLLRVLERREVKRIGAAKPQEVNVRIIAATHRDLPEQIRDGKFREDLYYRLAEVLITLPPLRERPEDIELLARHLVAQQGERSAVRRIEPGALDELRSRSWPGNVRELRNVLRRATALAAGDTLARDDLVLALGTSLRTVRSSLPPPAAAADGGVPVPAVGENLPIRKAREQWVAPLEREYLVRLMKRCDGDMDRASEAAGIHRKSLERLLRQHGLKASELSRD